MDEAHKGQFAIGVAATLILSRFLRDLLFEVEPNDAATMCAAAGLLFAVSIAACYLPALRATRVNPTAALRGD